MIRTVRLALILAVAACGRCDRRPKPSSFAELGRTDVGSIVQLHLAPVAVTVHPQEPHGEMFPEPCEPEQRAKIGLIVGKVPFETARELNAKVNAETEANQSWTCYDVTVRVTAISAQRNGGVVVDADFLGAVPRGTRKVDQSLLSGD